MRIIKILKLFLILPRWLFDWKTPIGYLVAWVADTIGTVTVVMVATPFYMYLFGSCWLFISMADDIAMDVTAFNLDLNTETETSSAKRRAELIGNFFAIVLIYAHAKE